MRQFDEFLSRSLAGEQMELRRAREQYDAITRPSNILENLSPSVADQLSQLATTLDRFGDLRTQVDTLVGASRAEMDATSIKFAFDSLSGLPNAADRHTLTNTIDQHLKRLTHPTNLLDACEHLAFKNEIVGLGQLLHDLPDRNSLSRAPEALRFHGLESDLSQLTPYRPITEDVHALSIAATSLSSIAASVLGPSGIEAALVSVRSPWALPGLEEITATGIANFASLSVLAKSPSPFDALISEKINALMGQSSQFAIPSNFDRNARKRLYAAEGFDQAILATPEEVLREVAIETGFFGEEVDDTEVDVEISTRAFRAITLFEIVFRQLIERIMLAAHGDNWHLQTEKGTWTKWEAAANKAARNGKPRLRLIQYADLGHYLRLVEDFWPLFEPALNNKPEALESLRRIQIVRHPAFHARAVTQIDLSIVLVNTSRLRRAAEQFLKQTN